jgi:multidrug efflux system outer membrane protein
VTAPIFTPGARANVAYSQAQRDAAVASYQLAVQTAFREVADALAREGTIGAQRTAQTAQADAAAEALRLSEARYRAGIDDYLSTLTAQRSLYAARQAQSGILLEALLNRITLYQALGGAPDDWARDLP